MILLRLISLIVVGCLVAATARSSDSLPNDEEFEQAEKTFAIGYVIVQDRELAEAIGRNLVEDRIAASAAISAVKILLPNDQASSARQQEGFMLIFLTRVSLVQMSKHLIALSLGQPAGLVQVLFTQMTDSIGNYTNYIDKHTTRLVPLREQLLQAAATAEHRSSQQHTVDTTTIVPNVDDQTKQHGAARTATLNLTALENRLEKPLHDIQILMTQQQHLLIRAGSDAQAKNLTSNVQLKENSGGGLKMIIHQEPHTLSPFLEVIAKRRGHYVIEWMQVEHQPKKHSNIITIHCIVT